MRGWLADPERGGRMRERFLAPGVARLRVSCVNSSKF
jgi:hypothetical protein